MRDFKKRRYIFAFVITTSVFLLGFFFGFVMDLQRIDYFKVVSEDQRLNIRSLQIQSDIINELESKKQCGGFRFMFDKAITELEQNRERIGLYDQQSKVKKDDFTTLKREYTLSQINFWEISNKLKSTCPDSSEFITLIYFFSDTKNCPECEKQAPVLNYYKTQFKENLLIFAIDEQFESEEPAITLLKQIYNVTSYPTIIIEGEKYSGLVNGEEMGEILCELYGEDGTAYEACS